MTHDFDMAFEYSDWVIVMEQGRKIFEGEVRDALPALLRSESASMLPEILQLTDLFSPYGVPLTWDVQELAAAVGIGEERV